MNINMNINMKINMKANNYKWPRILLLIPLLLVGCGKDQSLEDYRQKKVSEEISHLEEIVGTYRGQLKDSKDGSDMGVVTFELSYTTIPVNSSDSSATASQAYVTGKVSLINESQSDAGIQQANYNWRTPSPSGNFSGKMNLGNLADGTIAQLNINGTLTSTDFSGLIEPNGVSGRTATFKATRLSKPDDKSDFKPVDPGSARKTTNYFSNYYQADRDCKKVTTHCLLQVTMEITESDLVSAIRFYNNFVLEKSISVTLKFWMVDANISYDTTSFEPPEGSAKLDQRSNDAIHAKTTTMTGTSKPVFYLDCYKIEKVIDDQKTSGWSCKFSKPGEKLDLVFFPFKP